MEEKYLEYALEHLERELDIIDNPYVYEYDEDKDMEVRKDNPYYVDGVHDSPYYRSEIAKDLHDIKQMLGG
ncbi:hypothetical protein [Streptococcus uberis]|uniref:hypothetical protein n=1 Tax=Streptococcus uberis TaxID=1349 RepID=UPI0006203543|nr:hypothetical protein [Streptococcus uberis]KKF40872.1 hypothetical protein AF64_08900 [Streptococcus uberis C9359]KKF51727.1 hypothetical protein AF65_08960 [Streptococcus uberis C5388]QBX22098.1 hypothetical protein Javan633_0045 [Streptococcus phage Javan633]QBX31289.1 hypothetical protein Javan628_0045 [Streptococcus phage Javan628]